MARLKEEEEALAEEVAALLARLEAKRAEQDECARKVAVCGAHTV